MKNFATFILVGFFCLAAFGCAATPRAEQRSADSDLPEKGPETNAGAATMTSGSELDMIILAPLFKLLN
jgi:hypothetical protein